MRTSDEGATQLEPSGSPASANGSTTGPWQFGLASLLLYMTICAAALGFYRSLGPELVVFIIAFATMWLVILRAMSHRPPGSLATIELRSEGEAHACRNYLRGEGITAEVVTDRAFEGLNLAHRPPRIVVPDDQYDRARELLARLLAEESSDGAE